MLYKFYITNEENKVNINLSEIAYNTMQSDILSFNCNNRSEYINCVFECFAEQSKASINNQLKMNREFLENVLRSIDDSNRKNVISIMQKQLETDLIKSASSYPNGVGFKIRIRNNNYEVLRESTEAKYYCKNSDDDYAVAGKYIKAIIEEFTRLPYIDRESIYNVKKINTINAAIYNRKTLKIKLFSNSPETLYVQPHSIKADSMNMYNYLVGYSYKYNTVSDKNSKRLASIRINRIKDLRMLNENAIINKKEKDNLKSELLSRGVQFLLDDTSIVKVRLTKLGKNMYNSRIHLRPPVINIEEDIYTFNCTKRQAQYFFFSFGDNAKIIEPDDLANKFKCMYKSALDEYMKSEPPV